MVAATSVPARLFPVRPKEVKVPIGHPMLFSLGWRIVQRQSEGPRQRKPDPHFRTMRRRHDQGMQKGPG
jgi:hypothetical protein